MAGVKSCGSSTAVATTAGGFFWRCPNRVPHSRLRNCCSVRPASRTMPAMVWASTGSCRGIVTILTPSGITMCLLCRATENPAFCNVLTALRCGTPAILPTATPECRLRGDRARRRVVAQRRCTLGSRPGCLRAPLPRSFPVTSNQVNLDTRHYSLRPYGPAQRDTS